MRFMYTEADGRVAIATAAPIEAVSRALGAIDGDGNAALSPEAYREHVITRLCETTGVGRGDLIELPDDWQPAVDRTWRDAWRLKGRVLCVDLDIARALHLTRLRRDRAPRLAELDITALRALESGLPSEASAAKALKQRLRDVTADPRIAAATTPEELAQLTLDALTA